MLVSNGFQARDAAKHCVMHRTVSVTKNYPGPNVSSSKTEKPWSRQITRISELGPAAAEAVWGGAGIGQVCTRAASSTSGSRKHKPPRL